MKRSPLLRRRRIRPVSERMAEEITPADRVWSLAVRTRDGWYCRARRLVPQVACLGEVVAHHVYPKEDYPRLRHELDNGVSLCPAHHRWVHDVDPWAARGDDLRLLGPFRK